MIVTHRAALGLPIASVLLFLGACTATETTRLSPNMVRIDATVAPACGAAEARKLVAKMAAVETIRLVYHRH